LEPHNTTNLYHEVEMDMEMETSLYMEMDIAPLETKSPSGPYRTSFHEWRPTWRTSFKFTPQQPVQSAHARLKLHFVVHGRVDSLHQPSQN